MSKDKNKKPSKKAKTDKKPEKKSGKFEVSDLSEDNNTEKNLDEKFDDFDEYLKLPDKVFGDSKDNEDIKELLEPSIQNRTLREIIFNLCNLLARIRKGRINIQHDKYNTLIDKELPDAITEIADIEKKGSDPEEFSFKPSYHPMLKKGQTVKGVNGLESFMLSVYYENEFCHEYEDDEISEIYRRYSENGEGEVNIYRIVLPNALFSDYLTKEHGSLILTRDDCATAENMLNKIDDEDEARDILFDKLLKLSGGDPDYNESAFNMILFSITDSVKKGNLAAFLGVNE